MKSLTQFINEAKKSLIDIQDDTINYIPANELKKYLEIAAKFISDDTKEIVNYLIVNNSSYIKDFGNGNENNALAHFYNNGPYKETDKKELYNLIKNVNKSGRLLEIPVFQTEEQFKSIIDKKVAPDEIIIDLTSEAGRNIVAKKYEGLCHKLAHSFKGKSNLDYEELLAYAYEGLTRAMNGYGKKSLKARKREEQTGEELDISNYKTTTFLSFAAHAIRFTILDAIKNDSQVVRVPTSKQAAERKEKGYNTKNNSVSGDKSISGEEGGKSLFDLIGDTEDAGKSVNDEEIKRTWEIFIDALKKNKKINPTMLHCWMATNEIGGVAKEKGKDLATKLGVKPSSITYYCRIVQNQILEDPKLSRIAKELITLYNEALQDSYSNDLEEPYHITINEKENTANDE